MPGKTAADSHAAGLTWKALHDELIAASASQFRQDVVVPGANHNLHRSSPDTVIAAAREFAAEINTSGGHSGRED